MSKPSPSVAWEHVMTDDAIDYYDASIHLVFRHDAESVFYSESMNLPDCVCLAGDARVIIIQDEVFEVITYRRPL